MYCGKFEAARKFWETPVLVNKLLLPYLDLESTLHLAQTHELTRDILQDSFAWNKLVSRTRIQDGGSLSFPFLAFGREDEGGEASCCNSEADDPS